MESSPVFLLASERSGTNLMRTRLNNHSKIAAPPPIHFFTYFYNIEYYYGNLEKEENINELINDMFSLNNASIEPWNIKFTKNEIKASLKEISFTGIYQSFFDLYTENENKSQWFCKENKLFDHAWKLNNYFPNCKFLYLVRDPRDVFVSYKKRAVGEKTAFAFAKMWKNENNKCLRLLSENAFKDKILLVKYEEVLNYPEKTFIKICHFIGQDYEPGMLEGKKSRLKERTQEWENISKNIIKNNSKKYVKSLNKKEIKIIEKILNKEMMLLDYSFEISNNKFKPSLSIGFYYFFLEYIKRGVSILFRKRIRSVFIKERQEEYRIRKMKKQVIKDINAKFRT